MPTSVDATTICRVEACESPGPIVARGWCGMHYRRWVRTGNPGEPSTRRQGRKPRPDLFPGLVAVMAETGREQTDIAVALGLHQSTISRKMQGASPWRLPELQSLAGAWNVPLFRLLGAEPSAVSAGDTVSAAPSTAGVRRQQTSAGPTRRPKQPNRNDLNGKRRKKSAS